MESSDASTASRWSPANGGEAIRVFGLVAAVAALVLGCVSRRSAPEVRENANVAPPTSPASAPIDPRAAARLPFYSTADFTAEWLVPGSEAEKNAHRIGPFSFTDQNGKQVSRESLRGRIYVADFFFSSCPSLCPKMTATFQRIQGAFAGDDHVVLVSHTVDPTTDTPERLAAFASKNGVVAGQWHLVTGEQDAIYPLARTSYFAEKELGLKKTNDEFLHTENMLLVDGEGHLRGVYNATLPAEAARVVEDIRQLETESM
jgi:protein SCO1